jgi:phage baseplate assembly protein gpV
MDAPNAPSVSFSSDVGPLVSVRLHPGDRTVRCRVASFVAGNGEGEWHPFVGGDEVIVGIPEGNTRAGCVILGRLNNAKDVWPAMVAGQDATKNATAFRRLITPYALELGAGLIFSQPLTHAQLALDDAGNWTMADGAGDSFFMNASGVGFQTSGTGAFVQLDPSKNQVHMNAGGTDFLLDAKASTYLSAGTLSIGTSGIGATGHAITTEQFTAFLEAFFIAMGTLLGQPPFASMSITNGSTLGAIFSQANVLLFMNAAIPQAQTFALTTELPLIATALAVPQDPTGTVPSIGKPGLMF